MDTTDTTFTDVPAAEPSRLRDQAAAVAGLAAMTRGLLLLGNPEAALAAAQQLDTEARHLILAIDPAEVSLYGSEPVPFSYLRTDANVALYDALKHATNMALRVAAERQYTSEPSPMLGALYSLYLRSSIELFGNSDPEIPDCAPQSPQPPL